MSNGSWETIPEEQVDWGYMIKGPYSLNDTSAKRTVKSTGKQYTGGVRQYIEELTQDNIQEDDFDLYSGNPGWQMHLIEGENDYMSGTLDRDPLKEPKKCYVLLFRLHHVI